MKKFLKVILWIFAVLGVLVLLGLLAFGIFIYREVDKRVLSYNCQSFTTDIESLSQWSEKVESEADKYAVQMKAVSLMTSLVVYTEARSKIYPEASTTVVTAASTSPTELQFMKDIVDGDKFKQKAREFYSFCKENPEIVPVEYFAKFEKDKFQSADVEAFKKKLEALPEHKSEMLDFYVDMISNELQRRVELGQDFEALVKNQSPTVTVPEAAPEAAK